MTTIRHLHLSDDLVPLLGADAAALDWNCENVYVAEADECLIGVAIVFDAGHDLVLVDYVRVLPEYQGRGLWARFLKRIRSDMQRRGRKALIGYADNPIVLRLGARLGASVGETPHYSMAIGLDHGD